MSRHTKMHLKNYEAEIFRLRSELHTAQGSEGRARNALETIRTARVKETSAIQKMNEALRVFTLDKKIAAWLEGNDPKALEQARVALKALEATWL